MSSDGVEKSVRMLQRRGCLAVRSRSLRRQPEKLGCSDRLYAVFFYIIFAVLVKYHDVNSRHFFITSLKIVSKF